jgi:hypothetical protein
VYTDYNPIRPSTPRFYALTVHTEDTKLAAFVKLPSGSWRAVVRRKNKYVGQTFHRKEDARAWALEAEYRIDKGDAPSPARASRLQTFGDMIDLHIADMKGVGIVVELATRSVALGLG